MRHPTILEAENLYDELVALRDRVTRHIWGSKRRDEKFAIEIEDRLLELSNYAYEIHHVERCEDVKPLKRSMEVF